MPSTLETAQSRRVVRPGYPRTDKFVTPEELAAYFSGEKIICLRCGKAYRSLGVHLKTIHEMEPDEYRAIYGIPWTYGLSCSETKQRYADGAKEKIRLGIFKASAEQAALARQNLRNQKPRQPVRSELLHRNLSLMNAGKTGEEAERRRLQPARGTPEFKQKMRERPQTKLNMEILRTYWIGREQTDEHVFNRTGSHKKKHARR